VLHTVGPSVRDGAPTERDRAALGACYRVCLDEAVKLGVESVAFCAISTGVFGYPRRQAARVALGAVREFIEGGGSIHVVLVAFSEDDERACREAIEEMAA
jgi:O-acetyl-ADP-ribose deacetylase (regulator of RNase III)